MKIQKTPAGRQQWLRQFTAARSVADIETALDLLENLQHRDLTHLKAEMRDAVAQIQKSQGKTEEEAVRHFTAYTAKDFIWAPKDGQSRYDGEVQ